MPFTTTILVACITATAAVVAAWMAARTASKERVERRHLERTIFLQILSVAHGGPDDVVGRGEQLAAITLAAEFALAHPWLNDAAIAALEEIGALQHEAVRHAAERALTRLRAATP